MLRGLMLPFPTPFDTSGEVDFSALRFNLGKWMAAGVRGFVPLGSTGERVHLDEHERLAVIEATREAVPATSLLIAGAGQQSIRGTIIDARRIAAIGADALLVITPSFYRSAMTQSALVDYYLAVADSAPIPIVLYSMPDLTGIAISPATVARLSAHENIIGIKDSSGDIINFAETLRLVPQSFPVLTGNGALLYSALSEGARGAILAVGCVAPAFCLEIIEAMERGDQAAAAATQRNLMPLARAVTARYGIGGLKAAMNLAGYRGGEPRAPLSPPSAQARDEIATLLRDLALLVEQERPLPDAIIEGAGLAGAVTR